MQPDKTGYAPAHDLEVYYEVYGSGKPLLLLHGGLLAASPLHQLYSQIAPKPSALAIAACQTA